MGTHLEYISNQKFNSSFKNMLRDFYVYGFKNQDEYPNSLKTFYDDRMRLMDFLRNQDYLKWEVPKQRKTVTSEGKNVTFITCDSQSMSSNPFQSVYRFCGTDRLEFLYYFFHSIAALDGIIQLAESPNSSQTAENDELWNEKLILLIEGLLKSINVDKGHMDALSTHILYGEIKEAEKYLSDQEITKIVNALRYRKMKTSEIAKFFSNSTFRNPAGEDEREKKKIQNTISKTINNRLQKLSDIGILQCDQKNEETFFSAIQVEQILSAIPRKMKNCLESDEMVDDYKRFKKTLSAAKSGDRNWYLSGLSLKRVLDAGGKVDAQFLNHFIYALDYYGKTFLFGEIGMFLLDRLGEKTDCHIRIEHEYYMHALNDYNAIDLLAAIENNEWCLITYKRDKVEIKVLCYPIELRISSMNGREYLMYYEPFKKNCSALRLEFIESIVYFDDYIIKKALQEENSKADVELSINQNLNRAKLLMDYTWGVSTGSNRNRNIEHLSSLFKEIKIRILYNKETDYYILNRMYRESRIGRIFVNEEEKYIDFSLIASDINEVIPFIRSFYSRVISCTGYDMNEFSVEMDISQILKNETEEDGFNEVADEEPQRIEEGFLSKLGTGTKADEHKKLFNEVFSVFYYIFAAIIEKLFCEQKAYTGKEINNLCKTIMYEYKDKCGTDMLWKSFHDGNLFVQLLKDGGFLIKETQNGKVMYRSKYKTDSHVSLYRDIIPLSEIEIRWLKTILADEKIHYFLSDKEILAIKMTLAETATDIKPFPMRFVNYYDRYKFSPKKEWRESTVFVPILDSIRNNHVLKMKYESAKKNIITGDYKPILVEYSKRDDCFKGYFMSCRKKEGLKVYNLAQIISVEETDTKFDETKLMSCFDSYRKKQIDTVEIEFKDNPGLVDRVLTEFSPWRKQCEYNTQTKLYHLIIYYPKEDGTDMAIRILRFGSGLHLVNSKSRLALIMQNKLKDQMDRMAEKSFREDDKGWGSDR